MKHPFIKSSLEDASTPLLQQICASCKYPRLAHTKNAECEVCGKVGECDIFMTILMCPECTEKESKTQEDIKNTADERVNIMNDYYKIRDATKEIEEVTSLSYFNARITPIVELKEKYELNGHTFQEFHERIKNQILHFSQALFEAQVESKPDELANLIIELRAETRTKLKERDINYVPPTKAPKVPKPKSGLEKAALALIKVAEANGQTMTMQEAKAKLLKELGL